MTVDQFEVLYRKFLVRMIDLEFISPDGDVNKLLGNVAAALVCLGSMFAIATIGIDGKGIPQEVLLVNAWALEHSLIATTMLVVGVFAVLSWDSTFPSELDVLVLSPLPVRSRTFFFAKVAALTSVLACAVFALNALPGLALPFALSSYGRSILELLFQPALYRSYAAYWITVSAAGAFIFCSILCVQGFVAQILPRRLFLRVSAFLQMSAFSVLCCVYFFAPNLASPGALEATENQKALAWLPSYWFLAVWQQLNGSLHPVMVPLAARAWTMLGIVALASCALYLLYYVRRLPRIIEEPGIAPSHYRWSWLPSLENSLQTAVTEFSLRTLMRSRQHRVILAFYLGIAFAIVILYLKTPAAQRRIFAEANISMMFSSVMAMAAWVIGIRVVFSLPLALKANWIFRITEVHRVQKYLIAIQRSLLLLAVAPVWTVSSVLFLSIWPWWQATGHLIVLGLWGTILAYVCLYGFQKIPFTCSYLPGKIPFHFVLLICPMLLLIIGTAVKYERRAIEDPARYWVMVAALGLTAIVAWRRTVTRAMAEEAIVQFDDSPLPEIQVLNLQRDGVLPS